MNKIKVFFKKILIKILGGTGKIEPKIYKKEEVVSVQTDPEPLKPPEEIVPMYPENIKNYEEIFETTKKDSDGTSYSIKQDVSLSFKLKVIAPLGVTNFYYMDTQKKSTIVLHFTVGFLTGDIATLVEQDSYVSVSFVIGRNGTVYQLFKPDFWAYHLGKSAVGGNTLGSKKSIAIELSNIGPLTMKNDDLYSIYGSKYCSLNETFFYTILQEPFRGYTYFATFTDQQYKSLDQLIIYLCDKFNIPKYFLNDTKRYKLFSDTEAKEYEGICSHINFRGDGKVDIGPAFEWIKIINP